ncbi:MAG: histidinol-phosphatase HisJ [candidate division KSB1 bacterium]|nr:histidinol-phosphatase HisJ [candidate division KSB1 bacterium]MDZ7377189.1 histidinol-phosphatase HisJ [candidate division KSB1 bacterium]MDZ7399938.1 histidinol-phosphatase HisJ [candidate division KSB1 bacterium]
MNKQLADYHIHTSLCNHANGAMKAYVKQAITLGLCEMGFADHNPLPAHFNNPYRMLTDEMSNYLEIIHDLRQQFPQIIIRTGIELDYIESATDFLEKLVTENKFDYVIGSVHYLQSDAKDQLAYLSEFSHEDTTRLFHAYFDHLEKAIKTGWFDIIGHFDLPRRFWGDLPDETIERAGHILEQIKDYDLCLEVNTSGFRTKNVEEPFPNFNLLQKVRALDIPVTLGSDAHQPGDVGSYFQETKALLKQIGFEYIYFFENHRRIPHKI